MLPNCCELYPVASGFSHELNASDKTRIGLQTGLKWALNRNCAGCWNSAAHRAADVSGGSVVSGSARRAADVSK